MEKDVLKSEEIRKLISGVDDTEVVEKESAIAWDGKNLVIRMPKEIAEYIKINKENRFEKSIKFRIENKEGIKTQTFEIVQRTKPQRKTKNGNTSKKKTSKNNRAG